MPELSNTELTEQLEAALQRADAAALTVIFERLALLDGYRIAKRARKVLEALTPEVLETLGADPIERAHQVTMSLFRASVLSYFEDKPALVDPSIKGDITAWIDANADAIASANLQLMEDAIADSGSGSGSSADPDFGSGSGSGSGADPGLEPATPGDSRQGQQAPEQQLASFRQLIERAACVHHQRRILRDIWAGVETAIAELLSADFG
jgi:hypothetical protein